MDYPWRIAPQDRFPRPLGFLDGDGRILVCMGTLVRPDSVAEHPLDEQNTGLLCVHEGGSRCSWDPGRWSVPAAGTWCTAPSVVSRGSKVDQWDGSLGVLGVLRWILGCPRSQMDPWVSSVSSSLRCRFLRAHIEPVCS